MVGSVVAGGLPPLLPTPRSCIGLTPPPASYVSKKRAGRATLSQSWIKDKLAGGGGGESSDRNPSKMPVRASLGSSWVEDKLLGRAGPATSGVERASRPTWRDDWNGSKRAASRAPSADRFEKKAKPPTDDEDDDFLDLETRQYAGPTFSLSPDPSQLPIPFLFMKAH
ncbi:hypothetical protein QYE76_067355 [Lolium multiflorum]|uniref:Uncharacterized protein n=1 Tax=Lolium multiflorum TaxID=4521 RepID=A0AAD8WBK9_LOLMU|nr:hypothetical protein QYE76_067355 [Lolium multiflorum]